tara:strand:+ start:3674 stop:4105 length:432 start_codon:yes stop_codon:yes gene_type:complete
MGLVKDPAPGDNKAAPEPKPKPPPELDERTQALTDTLKARLNANEERLAHRPFDTNTLAEVVAHCLVAAEDIGGSRGAQKETLRPDPKKLGGFDPLWSQKTYELVEDRGSPGIKCLRCNRTSYHPEDVRQRYCGYCHEFHNGQ